MKISESAEEVLELLWLNTEEGEKRSLSIESFNINNTDEVINEMLDSNLISVHEKRLSLTNLGRNEAKNIVRRHRLAERLMTDVLDTDHEIIEDRACHFEHFLHEGIDDNICILLGHPKVCPHGKPIPPGDCCREYSAKAGPVVISLTELDTNQVGEIAYVLTQNSSNLQKLMATGVLPGMDIQLIQKFPSYVFQVGETQIAVDREIAKDIFVRIGKKKKKASKTRLRRGKLFNKKK